MNTFNFSKENIFFLRGLMRALKALRSMLMRVGDGSEGKFGVSQEYNTRGGKSYFPQRESLAPGSSFFVITHALIKILKTN